MKRCLKIVRKIVLVAILCVAALVSGIEFLSWRAKCQVTALVSDLVPGTPLSAVIARLGPPTRTVTDAEEMRVFNHSAGQGIDPNSTLYLFVHRGPPFRWILIYTDKASQRIQHAEWQDM